MLHQKPAGGDACGSVTRTSLHMLVPAVRWQTIKHKLITTVKSVILTVRCRRFRRRHGPMVSNLKLKLSNQFLLVTSPVSTVTGNFNSRSPATVPVVTNWRRHLLILQPYLQGSR